MNAARVARWVLGIALLAAGAWIVSTSERAAPPVQDGLPAPSFRVARLGGGELSLDALRGKVVLVNFWATWCAPCEKEMPAMQRLFEQLAPRGFELVAISVDEQDAPVAKFRERLRLSFPIGLDPKKEAAQRYQSLRYPESFLIDRQGILVARYIGERDWDAPEYAGRIARLLDAD